MVVSVSCAGMPWRLSPCPLAFSSYASCPSLPSLNLHRAVTLGMILTLSLVCCPALKLGLLGPWSRDSFFSEALPDVAAQLAVERIEKDPSLSAIHRLDYVLLEEDGQAWKALARFADSSKNLSAFVGPLNPSHCEAASWLAQGWNKPMLSWACLEGHLDNPINQPTFIRTLPPAAAVLLTVLKYFSWAHVGIVSSEGDLWVGTAHKLASVLRSHGLPVALVTSTGTETEKVEETWSKIQAAGTIKGKRGNVPDGKLTKCRLIRSHLDRKVLENLSRFSGSKYSELRAPAVL